MNILFGILAGIFAVGMIGDKEKDNRQNYTIAFTACILAVVALNILN